MRSWIGALWTFAIPALVLGGLGCDVEQTEEGEAPEVEVDPGEVPEYDVEGPEVDVEEETEPVQVPDVDVDTETRQVETPDVDVDLPAEDEQQ